MPWQASQADIVDGDAGPNLLAGSAAPSLIRGLAGNDTIWGDPPEAYQATSRVIASSDKNGDPADGFETTSLYGDNASFSSDGNLVVFTSWASGLVPEVTGDGYGPQVYLKNLRDHTIRLISANSDGTPFYAGSNPSFSPDSKLVAFQGERGESSTQVYVKNLATDILSLVSRSAAGTMANDAVPLAGVQTREGQIPHRLRQQSVPISSRRRPMPIPTSTSFRRISRRVRSPSSSPTMHPTGHRKSTM